MIRLSAVFWLLLVSGTALATFAVKYEVQSLDDGLGDARKATAAANRELRALDAEWAYLNRPDMLAAMNQRFLSLAPIARRQLETAITDIPMRPQPVPPPQPAPGPTTGPVAGLDRAPPRGALPVAAGVLDGPSHDTTAPESTVAGEPVSGRPAMPERLAPATTPVKPLLVKAAAVSAAPPSARAPEIRSLDRRPSDVRALDSRSLDRLIARIAARR